MTSILECPALGDDASYWWDVTGKILQTLLSRAGYSAQRQHDILLFYGQVVQSLGSRPTADRPSNGWQSFMTDDFSPLEFSWHWGNAKTNVSPTIRLSIEAIGDQAGTPADPWNQKASIDLLDRLRPDVLAIDLQWYKHLARNITPVETKDVSSTCYEHREHRSSIFLAFEFIDQRPRVKAYMLPLVKAIQTSQTTSTVVQEALASLAQEYQALPALYKLLEFLETTSKNHRLQPMIVGVDCVEPSKSRIKVYVRSPDTSYASVAAIMGMFDDGCSTQNGLKELRHLWQLVLGLKDNFNPEDDLPFKAHCTSGVLYYFEVHAGSWNIKPKVYIPVKHYGCNDEDIAQGLRAFLVSRKGTGEQPNVENYLQALRDICTYRSLRCQSGLQTYISCAIQDDSLDITSYISPEIYHKGRWDA